MPSQTTTTTCRSDLAVSFATPMACEHKSNATIEIDVQYSRSMLLTARRVHRDRCAPKPNPFPNISWALRRTARRGEGAQFRKILFAAAFLPASALAAALSPTATGTAWRYNMAEGVGSGRRE